MINYVTDLLTKFAACDNGTKFGLPTWYKYLPGENDPTGKCVPVMKWNENAFVQLASIGLAIVEILLYVAGIVAVAYVFYGGFLYMTSQGDPEKARTGKEAVLNALIGVVIAIAATAIVNFIGNRLTS